MSWMSVLARDLAAATGEPVDIVDSEATAGGSINRATVLRARDGRRFFVKLNVARRLDMFEAEADGLRELAQARALRVPAPLCSGSAEGQAWLALEYLDLGGRHTPAADRRLGEGLAALHRVSAARFGWQRDNTIGATAQPNRWCDDWIEFWRERRLRFQLELAEQHGGAGLLADAAPLLEKLPALFDGYRPASSLLHGDLWGGNAAVTADGEPAIFDPAVYYGDREADLAMTELFGGFTRGFYDAYRAAWPLDAGYAVRRTLYNLYHVLNHFNLFGGGYREQARHMIQQLLAELR